MLINMRLISTADLTVFFIPYPQPPYVFITTLKGFLFLDEKDKNSEEEVANIVGNTLFSTNDSSDTISHIKRFLAKYNDNIPATIKDVETTLRYLRSSITVRRLNLLKKENIGTGEGESYPAWNIYINPPTTNLQALTVWRNAIRKITFITKEDGAGRTYKEFRCTVCHSSDHPGGLCPYPSLENWLHKPPLSSPALEALLNPAPNQDSQRVEPARGRNRNPNRPSSHINPNRRNNGRN